MWNCLNCNDSSKSQNCTADHIAIWSVQFVSPKLHNRLGGQKTFIGLSKIPSSRSQRQTSGQSLPTLVFGDCWSETICSAFWLGENILVAFYCRALWRNCRVQTLTDADLKWHNTALGASRYFQALLFWGYSVLKGRKGSWIWDKVFDLNLLWDIPMLEEGFIIMPNPILFLPMKMRSNQMKNYRGGLCHQFWLLFWARSSAGGELGLFISAAWSSIACKDLGNPPPILPNWQLHKSQRKTKENIMEQINFIECTIKEYCPIIAFTRRSPSRIKSCLGRRENHFRR